MKRVLLLCVFLISACAPQTTLQTPIPLGPLLPYDTRTPSTTPRQPEGLVVSLETPLPSPTPFVYPVQAGDTMSQIAERFGISLDVLMAANPNVSPNSMSIGMELRIPSDPTNPTGASTSTLVPVSVEQIQCYPTADRGLWCFVLVHNDTPDPLENLSAQVTLVDVNGQEFLSAQALAPLNILPPGKILPLMIYFPPTIPPAARPRAQILSVIRLLPNDARYLSASAENTLVLVDSSGRTAQVSGTVRLLDDTQLPSLIWVAAVAYDEYGRVVGVRRWESENGGTHFDLEVSSVAGKIEKVEFVVEARP